MRAATRKYQDTLAEVIADPALIEHWPLTVRQVYYQLVAAGLIANNIREYKKLSRELVRARQEGRVPWNAIEDRGREYLDVHTHVDCQAFVRDQCFWFLKGFRRDLLQTQDVRPEIWVEKDALSRIVQSAANPFGVSVVVARGFASMTFKHEARLRIEENQEQGQRTAILYVGDLDPSGWEMLPSLQATLNDMGLDGLVDYQRLALKPDQVDKYKLPKNPDALKLTDPRAAKYVARFGDLAVELDALPPDTLKDVVRRGIERNLDLIKLEEQLDLEADETEALVEMEHEVAQMLERMQ